MISKIQSFQEDYISDPQLSVLEEHSLQDTFQHLWNFDETSVCIRYCQHIFIPTVVLRMKCYGHKEHVHH